LTLLRKIYLKLQEIFLEQLAQVGSARTRKLAKVNRR